MPKHRVAHLELRYLRTHGFHIARELDPERPPSRPADPGDQPPQEGIGCAKVHVALRDGARADPDEDLIVLRHRPFDLLDPEHLRRAVPILDHGFHRPIP